MNPPLSADARSALPHGSPAFSHLDGNGAAAPATGSGPNSQTGISTGKGTVEEFVVLVDDSGRPLGRRRKADVHGPATPLHLAFSLYLFDSEDRLLLTRRALEKRTWPGTWTNTCCGHPGPDESIPHAIRRRLAFELGVDEGVETVADLVEALPDYRYQATDASGVMENEICPVFTARLPAGRQIRPRPNEVMEHSWVPWSDVVTATAAAPFAFSPWAVEQIRMLDQRGAR